MLGISNGVDTLSLDDDCDDDDVTEPIAPCTSITPTSHANGVKDLEDINQLSTSDLPAGINCDAASEGHVTTIEVNGGHADTADDDEPVGDVHESIIDEEGFSLDEFIVYVRNKTRNGLFDEYQEIKSNPPEGTFDHARMAENLVKVF